MLECSAFQQIPAHRNASGPARGRNRQENSGVAGGGSWHPSRAGEAPVDSRGPLRAVPRGKGMLACPRCWLIVHKRFGDNYRMFVFAAATELTRTGVGGCGGVTGGAFAATIRFVFSSHHQLFFQREPTLDGHLPSRHHSHCTCYCSGSACLFMIAVVVFRGRV